MKPHCPYPVLRLVCFLSFIFSTQFANANRIIFEEENAIRFTENKGQVKDQFGLERPDILFYGKSHNFTFHILKSGASVQLRENNQASRNVKALNSLTPKDNYNKTKCSLYRVEMEWVNANTFAEVEKGEAFSDLENFYIGDQPNGVTDVNSYKSIRIINLYPGISIRWYQGKDGLEYDFEVSPGADISNIQLKINGAKSFKILKDGNIEINTPFGNLIKKNPVAIQAGGKLNAQWKIKDNILSINIENYDKNLPLIIDPVIRAWGTYFGGSNDDGIRGSSINTQGHIFVCGTTSSTANIATTGAYQTTLSGSQDAYIAKFNGSGVRLWATYYGGSSVEEGRSCAADVFGNVYLSGISQSSSGISTSSAYQTTYGGTSDAFLVKLNTSGTRLWATYFGGTNADSAMGCATDKYGNVFLTGNTNSASGISTSGVHQTVLGGGLDAFIAAFDTSGGLKWASYLGGSDDESALSCSADTTGNIYLAGTTKSTSSIASNGAHQTSLGGMTDGILAKFTSYGSLDWATYYGGNRVDKAFSCKADKFDNVFLAGETWSSGSIASSTAHQTSFGGFRDGFLIKFNGSGIRLWGTYYGGSDQDIAYSCTTDDTGNVFLAGTAAATAAIATSGAYQTLSGGYSDAFLAKFDSAGIRIAGTFYGGANYENGFSCSADTFGNVYLAGTTLSTSGISSTLSHQTASGGNLDGFLVKFGECITANAGPDLHLCSNSNSVLLGVNPPNGTGTWNLLQGYVLFVFPSLANTTIKNVANGVNILEWVVSDGYCIDRDTVAVYRLNSPPSGVTIDSVSGTSVSISWTASVDPDSFQIRYSQNCAAGGINITVPGNIRSYTINGLNGCKNYCLKIRSKCNRIPNPSFTVFSQVAYFTTVGYVPCGNVLSGIIAPVSGCIYNVDWSNGCASADSFRVKYRNGNNTFQYSAFTTTFNMNITLGQGNWEVYIQTWCNGQLVGISPNLGNIQINACSVPYLVTVTPVLGCDYNVTWQYCGNSDSFRIRYREGANPYSNSVFTTGNSLNLTLYPGVWDFRIQNWCNNAAAGLTNSYSYTISSCRQGGIKPDENSTFVLFPNPTTDFSILNFSSEVENDFSVQITDLSGKTIQEISGIANSGINSIRILTNQLPRGLYFLTLSLNNQVSKQIKLVKE